MIHNQIVICKDKEAVGKAAAEHYIALMNTKPGCVLGLATGSTPIPLYKELVALNKTGKIDFSKVHTVNLDEYKGLEPTHDQSFRYFMNSNLFNHVNIDKANTFVPNGLAEDVEASCKAYEEKIEELGGVDIQLLGIGQDGHIGFNEPDTVFAKATHETGLTEMTREANKRFFDGDINKVPKAAITMGVGTVMSARKVILIATGKIKAEIVKKSFFGPIDPQVPASALQMHRNVVVFLDEEAASAL